jgi:hypothetical protein
MDQDFGGSLEAKEIRSPKHARSGIVSDCDCLGNGTRIFWDSERPDCPLPAKDLPAP